MAAMMPGIARSARAFAIALACGAFSARAQAPETADSRQPSVARGPVLADCYARTEVWQEDRRVPVRLLFTRVAYNEATAGAVRNDLTFQWNKFIAPHLSQGSPQSGETRIVYCQYADAPSNSELSRWPSSATAAEQVEWSGFSISREAATPVAVPYPPPLSTPGLPPPAAMPDTPPAPAPVAQQLSAPMTPSQPAAADGLALSPTSGTSTLVPVASPADAPLAAERDGLAQSQDAQHIYGEILRKNDAMTQERRQADEAYRQQMEAYRRQLEAAQAAQRAFQEQQRQYEAEKATFEAQFKSGKKE